MEPECWTPCSQAPDSGPQLSQMNPIKTITSCFINICLVVLYLRFVSGIPVSPVIPVLSCSFLHEDAETGGSVRYRTDRHCLLFPVLVMDRETYSLFHSRGSTGCLKAVTLFALCPADNFSVGEPTFVCKANYARCLRNFNLLTVVSSAYSWV
jgi:hypothetical protein